MTNAEDIARGFRRPRHSDTGATGVDWEDADAKLLQKVIALSSRKHCALRFGYSRDGGAYSVGVYAGLDYFTDYIRPSESIDEYLTELLSSFEEYIAADGIATKKEREKGKR